jgi:hypothetical protein
MIDWLHCFGPVERQHIMGGTYRNKKGLPHSQKAKESKERTGVPRYPLIALPWGFKDLTLGSIYLLDVPQTLKVIAWGWSLSHRGFGGTFNIQSIVTWANSGLSYKMHVWNSLLSAPATGRLKAKCFREWSQMLQVMGWSGFTHIGSMSMS